MHNPALSEPLDNLLHQPTRTRIAAYLAAHGSGSFTDLKKALALTDGNLETHLKKLGAERYLMSAKVRNGGRTQTIYALTEKGERALDAYFHALTAILDAAGSSAAPGAADAEATG